MKLTLIIKQSINGCLAKNQTDDLSWGSPEDLKFFTSFTKDSYAMIMGSRTFLAMPEGAFGQRLSIVMTGQKSGHMGRLQQINKKLESKFESKKTTHNKATEIVILGRDPLKVIEFLKNRGLQKATLIGGGVVNSAFLNLRRSFCSLFFWSFSIISKYSKIFSSLFSKSFSIILFKAKVE